MAYDFGPFRATVPDSWTVGNDGDLIAIYPPNEGSYIQISTYEGPEDHEPTAGELWEFAEGSLEAAWMVDPVRIRRDGPGYALDAEGAMEIGGGLLAFRLWPGQLIFASFYHSKEAAKYVDAARAFMSSIRPSRDFHQH